jgi:hypothetical protein
MVLRMLDTDASVVPWLVTEWWMIMPVRLAGLIVLV